MQVVRLEIVSTRESITTKNLAYSHGHTSSDVQLLINPPFQGEKRDEDINCLALASSFALENGKSKF